MIYFSELGQNKELSTAELKSVYNIKIIKHINNVLIFESAQTPDIEYLGGTPKLGKVLDEYNNIKETESRIIKNLLSLSQDKKIFFGLSFYGRDNKKEYSDLGKKIKQELQNQNRKARWVISREPILSSVIVRTNKLLTRGKEFCLIFTDNKIYLSETIGAQNFSDYEARDMRRPARDLISGMTPPKLAKILINLASPPLDKGGLRGVEIISTPPVLPLSKWRGYQPYPSSPTSSSSRIKKLNFLDPFCGSGTFLMEAALLGFQNIYGSDISAKAILDSKTNLDWLARKYKLTTKFNFKQCDVRNIEKCWQKKFFAIAGEPYLGPPIRGKINAEQAKKLQAELQKNYDEYLPALSAILAKSGRLVLIVPFIIFKGGNLHLNLDIKKYGLKSVQHPILYSRPDQKIGREIYIIKKL